LPLAPGHYETAELARAIPGSAHEAHVRLTVAVTGGRPGSRYALVGNSCASTNKDATWAHGVANSAGSVLLATHVLSVDPGQSYWAWVTGPTTAPSSPLGGFRGEFGAGDIATFAAGHAPCLN
jgi:hypothetical protein